ncbi:hypothetical protein COV23_01930 [Candidatus Wolfebacteria bacterium CG10_big_fil_rev_8_21_14_0_10_31_9]|uniref:Uncharacterized protein n=1 Tax=Candidatus Wolfebacteria bacterium CG10_big_fil_rev_8_21_14_0_10_31_9 TaxID=1975070 RepID=A0A2H0RBY6_9BACT|nr:MAG: hypothetical protein COV23_01930 [Candidatus Wolfebacteria bacterium CG10_big_fil_rev_8_21_14_0_10_31_9]
MDNFNLNALELDIERLSQEIKEKKALIEHQSTSERDLIKQSLYPVIQKNYSASAPILIKPDEKIESDILPNYLKDSSEEIKLKVEELIDITFKSGIEKAASEASKFGPFIVDAYHDAVSDKLYEELVKRGKL